MEPERRYVPARTNKHKQPIHNGVVCNRSACSLGNSTVLTTVIMCWRWSVQLILKQLLGAQHTYSISPGLTSAVQTCVLRRLLPPRLRLPPLAAPAAPPPGPPRSEAEMVGSAAYGKRLAFRSVRVRVLVLVSAPAPAPPAPSSCRCQAARGI